MKTIKIRFTTNFAQRTGILLASLDVPIIMTWSEENLMDTDIFCICQVDKSGSIPMELRIEKIREQPFIKILNS